MANKSVNMNLSWLNTINFIELGKLKYSITWKCDAVAPFRINSMQKMRENTLLLLLRKQLIVCRGVISFLKNYFTASIIANYFNTQTLHKIIFINKIIDCLWTPFSKKLYRIETCQLICIGFYTIQVFVARYFRTDYS